MTEKTRTHRVRLRPANPFDLIRLIARSQSDPRKAVAELVQNCLDATATQVRVTWFTFEKSRALRILDDGEGVFPDLDRQAALERIATTIGHSHKAGLDPAERHRQMTLGKYGIGLLGFWSVAQSMEIRSRVGTSDVWTLRLEADKPDAIIQRTRSRHLPVPGSFTEVILRHVHPSAAAQVLPRRLAPYLAQELRGQLLGREVLLEVIDRVGRGRTQKRRIVRPVRFHGVAIEGLRELPVPGYRSATLELYLVPAGRERAGRVALSCGGTTVLDDIARIDGEDDAREPWDTGRLEGVIDFSELTVAPSTRRSFVGDAAAHAFRTALAGLEDRLRELLAEDDERRRQDEEADDARQLRRVFRRLPRLLPDYAMFSVHADESGGGGKESATPPGGAAPDGAVVDEEEVPDVGVADEPELPEEYLYPPGALVDVAIRPRRSRLAPGGARRLLAVPRDADGREIGRAGGREIVFEWSSTGPGNLEADGRSATFTARDEPGEAGVRVTAREGDTEVGADAVVHVTDDAPTSDSSGGIPDPEPVAAAGERWRSRVIAGKWQYNSAHADYLHVRGDRRRRLQYLVRLFAKELVIANFADVSDSAVLERMVQVLTYVGESTARAASKVPDAVSRSSA